MQAILYREALQAAADCKPLDGIGGGRLTNWKKLAEALDRLCPEQRSDAVRADWLLQIHSPAHQALFQIWNLLVRAADSAVKRN